MIGGEVGYSLLMAPAYQGTDSGVDWTAEICAEIAAGRAITQLPKSIPSRIQALAHTLRRARFRHCHRLQR